MIYSIHFSALNMDLHHDTYNTRYYFYHKYIFISSTPENSYSAFEAQFNIDDTSNNIVFALWLNHIFWWGRGREGGVDIVRWRFPKICNSQSKGSNYFMWGIDLGLVSPINHQSSSSLSIGWRTNPKKGLGKFGHI